MASRANQTRAVNRITAFSILLARDHVPESHCNVILMHFCCAQQLTSHSLAPSSLHHDLGIPFTNALPARHEKRDFTSFSTLSRTPARILSSRKQTMIAVCLFIYFVELPNSRELAAELTSSSQQKTGNSQQH
jgi:hypothetical protein